MLKKMRRRYLALEISAEMLSSKEFMDALWGAVLKLYGEYGASRTGLSLIDYDEEKKFAVIRTAHTGLKMVQTAVASITEVGNKRAAIRVLTVSGTIKTLYDRMKQ